MPILRDALNLQRVRNARCDEAETKIHAPGENQVRISVALSQVGLGNSEAFFYARCRNQNENVEVTNLGKVPRSETYGGDAKQLKIKKKMQNNY